MNKNLIIILSCFIIGAFIFVSACRKNEEKNLPCDSTGLLNKEKIYYNEKLNMENRFYYDNDSNLTNYESLGQGIKVNCSISFDSKKLVYEKSFLDSEGNEGGQLLFYWKEDSLLIENKQADDKGQLRLVFWDIYIFNSDSQIIKRESYADYVNSLDSIITTFNWEKGNIINSKVYDSFENRTYLYTYEYDDKKNPYNFYYQENQFHTTKNNIKKIIVKDIDGNVIRTTDYEYVYDKNDYPIVIRSSQAPNNNSITKVILEYGCD